MHRRALAVVVALALAGPSLARAAEPSPGELATARELFQQGLEAEDKNDWEHALELFRKVGAVKMTAQVRFHIGMCLENLGKLVDAYDEFMRARGEVEGNPKPDAAMLRAESDKHLADLKARIPRVILAVPADDSISVTIDGKPINPALFNTPIPLDPGTHAIVAKGAHGSFREKLMVVDGGGTRTITVTLEESPSQPSPERPTTSSWRAPPLVSIIAAGAGVALIGTSVALFSMSRSTYGDVRDECAGRTPCPRELRDRYEDGRTYNTWGNVLLVSGAVAVSAGVVLWVTAKGPETSETASRPAFGMSVGPFGINAVGTF